MTSEINRLKCEVTNRDEIIAEQERKTSNYEEGLSKALMRGVCALNMEAMSVLNNPDYKDSRLPTDFIGESHVFLGHFLSGKHCAIYFWSSRTSTEACYSFLRSWPQLKDLL